MALKIIGAGLGRTGTLSLKLALEHLGFDRCYHMSELLANMRSHLPLWIESAKGNPQWDTIFEGYHSTTDYPGCMFWRELAAKYPEAKIILTVRDPDKWFESGAATVFSPEHRARLEGDPMIAEFGELEGSVGDRKKMVDYFNAWNQSVIDETPPERLLVYRAGEGWEPLCGFLGVPVPPEPYPQVNSREEMVERSGQFGTETGPPPPEVLQAMMRSHLDDLKKKAFGG